MRVLVGTDGSVAAQAALRWALSLADAEGGELIVSSVRFRPFFEASAEEIEARQSEHAELLYGWCAPARESKVPFRELMLEGDPCELLLTAAEAEKVDLIVVGARGTGHRHVLHVGSTTHHLVHHTRLPIVAVPPPSKAVWPTTVVVGVDGSPGCVRAVDWLASFGAPLTHDVVAVNAQRLLAEWVPRNDPSSWYQMTLTEMQGWVAPLRESGLGARTLVLEGDAVDVLTDTAIAEEAGLLVVGSRGVGGIKGLRLGATALKVLYQAQIPVLMVPADAA